MLTCLVQKFQIYKKFRGVDRIIDLGAPLRRDHVLCSQLVLVGKLVFIPGHSGKTEPSKPFLQGKECQCDSDHLLAVGNTSIRSSMTHFLGELPG